MFPTRTPLLKSTESRDAVTTSDAVTRAGTFARSLADGVTTSDAWARVIGAVRSFGDTLTISTAWARVVSAVRAFADAVTTSDVLARMVSAVRAFADALSLSDALAWVGGGHGAQYAAELGRRVATDMRTISLDRMEAALAAGIDDGGAPSGQVVFVAQRQVVAVALGGVGMVALLLEAPAPLVLLACGIAGTFLFK